MRSLRFWSAVLVVLLVAQVAHGHGRFPATVSVDVQPGNDDVMLAGTTFDLLISRDGGTAFEWVCEEAMGYSDTNAAGDPDYAIAADGTMGCIGESRSGELLSCGHNFEPDNFALARSSDGTSWSKIMRFSEVGAAYQCPAETTQATVCEAVRFAEICLQFSCEMTNTPGNDAGVTPDPPGGGCCDAGARPTARSWRSRSGCCSDWYCGAGKRRNSLRTYWPNQN